MRLTIDTKEDSHEEIKHAISILNNLLERKGVSSTSSNPQPVTDGPVNMMSMFGDSNSVNTSNETTTLAEENVMPMSMFANPEPKKVLDRAPDFTSFLNLANRNDEEEKKEEARVEFF
jgi:hypothetical protein